MNQAQQPQVLTLDEIDPDTRKKATAAYNAGHGHAPDYGFAPDRAWIEGWAYAQSTKAAPATQPAAPVPQALTDAQITIACLSYRHDFGLMHASERKALIFQAREWERALNKARGAA